MTQSGATRDNSPYVSTKFPAEAVSSNAENIVVTGSALSTSNNTSANPVQIVTAKQIQQTGATTLSDFFQRLPSVGSSGTYNTQTNGTDGASCLDLRNLGETRVLVLIDGKRTAINGDSNCVDLNAIPVQAVASVEILKDGGSELYGADAVSGVVNIKLRHDLNDANVTLRGGITGHGDNQTGLISAYKGWNFDHGKGNLTLFASYMSQGGVQQADRSWSRSNIQINDPLSASNVSYGSIITPNGTFFGETTNNTYLGNGKGGLTDYTTSGRYNYGNQQSLVNALQNSSFSGDTHYDVNDHLSLYASVLYSHRTSMTQMAAEPVEGSVPPSTLPNSIVIPEDYPGNNTGEALQMYRRMTEFGNRETQAAVDTVTGKFGANGDIYAGWKYDLSYTYGASMATTQTSGVGDYAKLLQEYGLEEVTPGDANSLLYYNANSCAGSKGCVQSNVFQPLSSAAAQYANYTTYSHSHYQLRDLNLRINNNHVVHMPWSNGGDLGIALGMEHRGEQLTNDPDPLVQSGGSLTNTVAATSGGFNVTEGYIEGKLTLLKDAPLAHDLTIDGQGRYSSYNTFGSAYNWKGSIDWAPTRDIRFRGTIGTSLRQPNVYELYGGTTLSYNTASDPCGQASSYGARSAMVVANCAKQGINAATFTSSGSGQIPTLEGGNSTLKPEVGRTYTFGTVITPRWIPGLSTSVEYWHYNISDVISSLSTQYIVDSCYTGTNPSLCADVNRLSNGQINTVSALDENLGGLHTSGLDWDLNYRFRVTRNDTFTIDNNYQQLLSYKEQLVPGGKYYNYLGALFYQGGSGQPRVRDYMTLGWQHGRFGINYMMQYMGGMHWNDGSVFLTAASAGRYKTPAMVQQDITLTYNYKRWAFEGGVNNIAGKNPPFVASAADNSDAAVYGNFYYGRYFFLQAGVNF
ncbi:TonB-dependent receptor protein [Neoasaia chiangmaiensis NBRC 101099]|nr:TonB-dependent receptor protein [Neoasaia chiangmaiensis NBRC 101099]GEN14388.1 TonB-dependent receptor [Neoasaia chiangmaiensis]